MPTVIDLTTGLEHPRNCLLCSCDRSNDRRRAVPLYCKVCKTLVCTECMMDEPVRNYSDVDSVMVTCKDCGGGKKTKIYSSSSSSSSGDSPEGDESYDMEIESE
ncbi:hypothetical protein LIER_36049 [Lithospermum erythrorhizon]|uniref:B box-type domain-containing protein n=1 Tax=Lithospermum erythrorhizon TaxID=34254 RepID=A0AAV3NZY2_LITER